MSFLKSFANKGNTFPVTLNLNKNLKVRIYLHKILSPYGATQPISCWSYVTEGLAVYKQKELVFTLKHLPNEAPTDYPEAPLKLFMSISQWAAQGHLVDVGDTTDFGPSNFLGGHLAYIPTQPLENVIIPHSALQLILITEEEFLSIKDFGIGRLMARLGAVSRYFPCPPWSDRQRPSLSFNEIRQLSILTKIGRVRTPSISVIHENKHIVVYVMAERMTRENHRQLVEVVLAHNSIAFLTMVDSSADGCFVWVIGQGPSAITLPWGTASRISGSFVFFVAEQEQDEIRLIEDGIVLMLTNQSWDKIKQGLIQRHNVSLPRVQDGTLVELEWSVK